MKKILITGVTGFIGRNLFECIDHRFDCRYLIRETSSVDFIAEDKLIYINEEMKQKLCEFNPEVLLHLATYYTVKDDLSNINELIDANIKFGSFLLESLKNSDFKAFINIGSFTEFYNVGNVFLPNNFYSATKSAFRQILKYYKLNYNIKLIDLIFYNVYGNKYANRKKILDIIVESSNSTELINLSPGEQAWDFIHVNDVCRILLAVIEKINTDLPDRIEVGTGIATQIKELPALVESALGVRPRIKLGGLNYRNNEIMYAVAQTKALKEVIDPSTFLTLIEGMRHDYF